MQRTKSFVTNAGILGSLLTGVISVILLLNLLADFGSGNCIYSLPVIMAAITFGYLIRNVLVDNFHISRILMNVIAITLAISVPIARPFVDLESLWTGIFVFAILGTYLSCYFWLLSDERIG